MVQNMFEAGEATPSQAGAVLEEAANDWKSFAPQFQGSKSEWLSKMSELSTSLRDYVLDGSGDGPLLLSQLNKNMQLFDLFCESN